MVVLNNLTLTFSRIDLPISPEASTVFTVSKEALRILALSLGENKNVT